MAEPLESLSFGNFSIQDSMEGIGDTTLLNDLLGPETSTADAENLEPIIKEAKPAVAPATDVLPKGKEIVNKEEKDLTGSDLISNFLGDNTESEEQEEGTPEEKSKTKSKEETEESSPYSALSRDLETLGIFTKDEGEEVIEINTPEEFRDRFIAEKKKGAIEVVNNFIGQFGEDYQNAFDAIFVKGVNPKDYFNTYNTIADFATLDLTQEENQIKVIRQALTDQEFEPEEITLEIDRLKNYGDLEIVATRHHKVLVKKEATKLQQMEQAAQNELQQKAAIKNQYIQNVQNIVQEKLKTKEFDGIPINPKLANELQDFLLVDKYKTASGENLTDFDRTILELKRPENHSQKVKLGLILKLLEKDPTLSTIVRSGVTKKSDQIFGELARQKTIVGAKPAEQKTGTSWVF